jgi:prolyl 4-hydroxylase
MDIFERASRRRRSPRRGARAMALGAGALRRVALALASARDGSSASGRDARRRDRDERLPTHHRRATARARTRDDGARGRDRRVYRAWLARVCAMCLCAWLALGGRREGEERGRARGAARRFAAAADARREAPRTTVTRESRGTIDGEVEREAKNEPRVAAAMERAREDVRAEAARASLELETLRDEHLGDASAGLDVERVLESAEKAVEENRMEKAEMGVVFPPETTTTTENENGETRDDDDDDATPKTGMFSGHVEVSREPAKDVVIGSLEDELRAIRSAPHPELESPFVNEVVPKNAIDPTRIRTISLNAPRAFVYEGFLTDEECDHILALSKGHLHKSGVVDAKTGGSTTSDIRTSTGTFISRAHDPTITAIEERIELWSQIPVDHGEALQVLRYENGQEYKAHFDYFFHKGGKRNNRIATVLLYLSDVEEGGETVFPNTDVPTDRDRSQYSECGNGGKSVKARKGDALLFWSMKPGGELDPGSSHAGCPVIKGVKWTATKWMHVNAIGKHGDDVHKIFYEGGPQATESCKDTDDACRGWAESGECDKNPGFMLKSCAMSCRACQGDWRDGGYDKPKDLKEDAR